MTTKRVPRGTSTARVTVVGVAGIHKALAKWLEPELTAELDAANKKAANRLAKELRAGVRPLSKHMARAVRVKRARTGKPGWVVGSRRKIAYFWHFVINGTKAHGPRKAKVLLFVPGWNPYIGASSKGVAGGWVAARRVRGMGGSGIVEEVAQRNEAAVMRGIDQDMTRMTGT